MEEELNEEIKNLRIQNKVLQGKIRGYQTLGQLFKELKEKNRILEMSQNKSMVSVATEMEAGSTDKCGVVPTDIINNEHGFSEASSSAINKGRDSFNLHLSIASSNGMVDTPKNLSLPTTTMDSAEEMNIVLKKKLEDALQIVEEYERKRSNDKKLVKILNDEIKKTKDELNLVEEKLNNAQTENDLMMMKIRKLEQERDRDQLNIGATAAVTGENEGAEDWVHLHQGNFSENMEEPTKELTDKCKELEAKAFRWEREHFNLQREYTKHSAELRCLLESKSKELCKITEQMNVEKNLLEMKFKKLESMYEEEKKTNFDAKHNLELTIKKYKTLEKKFLALEHKNNERSDIKESLANPMDPTLTSSEQVLMLKQQLEIFKDDFEKEKKERIIAKRMQKDLEEKLVNILKQLEKKESELSKCEKSLADEAAKTESLLHKIKTLEANNKTVSHHNYLLLEMQSKMAENSSTNAKDIPPSSVTGAKLIASRCWKCKCCTFINDPQVENCKMCKAPRPVALQGASCRWKCRSCTFSNNMLANTCSICNEPRNTEIESSIDEDLDIDGPLPDFLLK